MLSFMNCCRAFSLASISDISTDLFNEFSRTSPPKKTVCSYKKSLAYKNWVKNEKHVKQSMYRMVSHYLCLTDLVFEDLEVCWNN